MALKMLTDKTAHEAAGELGISAKDPHRVIRKRLKSGEWPGHKKGKFWWFDPEEIREKIRG